MDLRQLRYYIQIVELGSISSAAQALHVAQPSLSQHVANLEAELETPLLIRGRGGVQATGAGEVLYRQAKAVLRQLEEAKAAVKTHFDTPVGQVTVGLPTSTSRVLAIPLMRDIGRRFPGICLRLVERSTAELAEAVASQKIDVAVCVEVRPQDGMHVTPVLHEEIMLVANADHAGRGPIAIEEVSRLPLILPSFPNSVRVLYEQALARSGLPLHLVAETSATGISLDAVAAGIGHTLQPWSATRGWRGNADQDFILRPFAPTPLVRRMFLCVSHGARSSRTCQVVEEAVLALMLNLVHSGAWQGVRPVTADGAAITGVPIGGAGPDVD